MVRASLVDSVRPPSSRPTLGRFLLLGLLLWALATAGLRLAGHLVLRPEPAWLWGTFLVGAVVITALAVGLRRLLLPDGAGADALALGILGPGLVLDAGGTLLFPRVFPNLDPSLDAAFAALMLWGYGLIALAIAVEARWSRSGRGGGRSEGPQASRRRPPSRLNRWTEERSGRT